MTRPFPAVSALCLFGGFILSACSTEPFDSADTSVDYDPPEYPDGNFTHKMMKNTDENAFAALAYECPDCTIEQHLAIKPPEGWTKGPPQVAVFSSGEMRSTPSFEGIPDTMDFVPEIPGEEYGLIAKTLSGVIVETGQNGVIVQAQVMRDTLFRYAMGSRVHELTDPNGNVFVLFAYGVDPTNVMIPDFEDADVLGEFSSPTGWTYSTRVLDEELLLDTPDIATVLAIRDGTTSTWERR